MSDQVKISKALMMIGSVWSFDVVPVVDPDGEDEIDEKKLQEYRQNPYFNEAIEYARSKVKEIAKGYLIEKYNEYDR